MDITGFKSHHFTIIGQNTQLEGQIQLQDQAQIWGRIKGDIRIREKIFIERTSIVIGDIYCHDIVVSGKVEGRIVSTGVVTLRSSAKVYGSVESNEIIINPGAILNSQVSTLD